MAAAAGTGAGEQRAGMSRDAAFGLGVAGAVHLVLAYVLATAGQATDDGLSEKMLQKRLCDGVRCPVAAVRSDRRGPDSPAGADLGVIEAMVIPQLGLADARHGLPKLVKYEQPEKLEEAVNIDRDPTDPREQPLMEVKRKEAERDKRKPGSLAAILGAPEDDDPRKRATALDRIVGSAEGSVWGSGTTVTAGNLYAGKVALAVRQQFTVPPFLSEGDLKRLRVRVKVSRMNEAGQVLAFELMESSTDPRFNAAAIAAVRKFAPSDGGTAYLPSPDAETLDHINRRGMVIDLDGALFKK